MAAVGLSVNGNGAYLSENGRNTATLLPQTRITKGSEDQKSVAQTVATPQTVAATPRDGLTLETYATAKRLPVDFLTGLGLSDCKRRGAPAVRIPYRDTDGSERAIRFRLELEATETDQRFDWEKGAKTCLYGLDRLKPGPFVVLAEGESCTQTLWHHGIPALGLPGASNWNEDRDVHHFDGFETVYVVCEPDVGGESLLGRLKKSSIRDRVKLVSFGEHKDVSELYLAFGDGFRQAFDRALEKSIPYEEHARLEAQRRKQEDWAECKSLAELPNILDRLVSDLAAAGLVGETKVIKTVFLATISRVFERPISLVVKGPSSGGKSWVVRQTLELCDPEAYLDKTGTSEKWLIYTKETLSHRHLVFYEAGTQGDFGEQLIRILLSEDCLKYSTVEKAENDTFEDRDIVIEGPTGFIATTTRISLHPENETRYLSLTVNDTQEQTKGVLYSVASKIDGRKTLKAIDVEPWRALHRYITSESPDVVVPFATKIVDDIPPVAVRLRRDIAHVFSVIRANALLHQVHRERDEQGRIVATLEDYAVAYDLLADILSDGVEAAVPDTIRKTVEAVPLEDNDSGVSLVYISKALKLHKSSISRHVEKAIEKGYLVNLAAGQKGKAARIKRTSDEMPENVGVLPSVERLTAQINGECCGPLPTVAEAESNASEPQIGLNTGIVADRCSVAVDFGEVSQDPRCDGFDSRKSTDGLKPGDPAFLDFIGQLRRDGALTGDQWREQRERHKQAS